MAMRIMQQERSTDHGCFLPVVPAVDILLADCIAGADCLSVRVVDFAAFPDPGNRGAWRSGVSEGAVLPPGQDSARPARHLKFGGQKLSHL